MSRLRYRVLEDGRWGVIKWFSIEKGWGFIVPENDETKEDVFLHGSYVKGTWLPQEGNVVDFSLAVDLYTDRIYAVDVHYDRENL